MRYFYLCLFICVTLSPLWCSLLNRHTPTGHTVFISTVNDHKTYCGVLDIKKGCANLSQCEDGASYICVNEIEMKVDK